MRKRFERGFTLVEIAVVILIIGLIAAFIIPTMAGTEDSARLKATEGVKSYIAEYRANNSTSYVDNLVVVNVTDSDMYIFGYSFEDDILYILSGTAWLRTAQAKAATIADTDEGSPLERVTKNIITSVQNSELTGENAYPEAYGLFTCDANPIMNGKNAQNPPFGEKTLKKMYNNTLFLEGEINTLYENDGYTVAYAEPELIDSSVASAEYTTVFMNDETEVARFNTNEENTFVCPEDPEQSGEYFIYWELESVNGEAKNSPATALAAGEEYEVPNSDVVYSAVFTSEVEPEIEDGAYRIYNISQLNWVGEHVTSTDICLMRSFDADGVNITPLGSSEAFSGEFDGNDFAIKNLTVSGTVNCGLFAETDAATIKDLTLVNPEITGDRFVAAVVGKAIGGTISNCSIVRADVKCNNITEATDRDHLYVEYIDSTVDPATTVLETGTYCGGVVGYGKNVTVRGCAISGTVNGGNSGSAVGGIIGAGVGTTEVRDSNNAAMVEGVRYVGGIMGKTITTTAAGATNDVVVDNCYNSGLVTRVNTIRALPDDVTDPKYTTEGAYCVAYGGIIGGTTATTTVSNCYSTNDAKVECDKTASYAGGIVGMADKASLSILNAESRGKVSFRTGIGGIMGANLRATLTITNSVNYANVTASGRRAGGILGYAKTQKTVTGTEEGNTIRITGCTNAATANVQASTRVGGILGDNERKTQIRNCVNNGNITENANMGTNLATGCGGISGYTVGKMTIDGCENNGTVKSGCQGVGGIIGKATSTTVALPTPTPAASGEPQPTLTPDMVTVKSEYTTVIKCANNGTVDNASQTPLPTETPDPSATPNPSAVPTPTPATPYTYAGGILGYSNEIVSIDYCYNAGYITANNNAGGISGAMATPTVNPDATATPVAVPTVAPTPEGSVDPATTPTPTQSLIKHSYNVGLVEADTIAGALTGTNEWSIETAVNFYLENCVQPRALVNIIDRPLGAGAVEYGTEKQANQFTLSEIESPDGVLALLNADRVASALDPYFEQMVTTGDTLPNYNYTEELQEVVGRYSEDVANRITLPQIIPILK